ncbi:M28 family peptidase [Methanosarcina sp. Z-7115]|uniref:M28 family peptidase n=1 Tax=Methanosarcina baikalica TaxID=3073890 RepID=A0ABU2D5P9_9EURY|nr:M28 family peptidase [Methanosarcina sp. Z-7115]MDR7667320.1 M28 family peptidase [Methanosarcina sp. Z-7115]
MQNYESIITRHLNELCSKIGSRPIGTSNNHKAEVYISRIFEELGLQTERQEYACKGWKCEKIELFCGKERVTAIANTYSNSCNVEAGFTAAGNIFELENGDFRDKIAIIYGELTQTPLAAKNNNVYNPEEHKRIIGLLEAKKPLAIIAVSHRTASTVPILEDWDFEIPSVTISAIDGMRLLKNAGKNLNLNIKSDLEASHAANVVGKYGINGKEKLVLCAHLDTKYGTDGASDNTSGVSALLTVAELLKDLLKNILNNANMPFDIEFVAFNGEEYYALGEILYTEKNLQNFENMIAAINLDGIGHYSSTSNIAFFECSKQFVDTAMRSKKKYSGVIQVDPWPSSDHTFFWMRKVPSIAISSTGTYDLFHTAEDTLDFVSIDKVEEVVRLTMDLVMQIIEFRLENKQI